MASLYDTQGNPRPVYDTRGARVFGTPPAPAPVVPSWTEGALVSRIVGDRTGAPTYYMANGNRFPVAGTFRTRHAARRRTKGVSILTGSFQSNDVTVSLAFETLDGKVTPLTFDGVQRRTLVGGSRQTARTDILDVTLEEGQEFFLRTYYQTPDTNGAFPSGIGKSMRADLGEGTNWTIPAVWGGQGEDWTTNTAPAWPSNAMNNYLSPFHHAILGLSPDEDGPSVVLLGDSIAVALSGESSTVLHSGFLPMAAADAGLPYALLGEGGKSMGYITTQTIRDSWHPSPLLESATHAIVEMGRNDVSGGGGAGLRANAINEWTYLAGKGLVVAQTTTTPWTSSTDSWTTVEGQTWHSNAQNPAREEWNGWLRDGAPIIAGTSAATGTADPAAVRAGQAGHPLAKVIEVTDLVETARNSGIWATPGGQALTNDGIHPNHAGHLLMKVPVAEWLASLT